MTIEYYLLNADILHGGGFFSFTSNTYCLEHTLPALRNPCHCGFSPNRTLTPCSLHSSIHSISSTSLTMHPLSTFHGPADTYDCYAQPAGNEIAYERLEYWNIVRAEESWDQVSGKSVSLCLEWRIPQMRLHPFLQLEQRATLPTWLPVQHCPVLQVNKCSGVPRVMY